MYKVNIINNNEVITINEASIDIDSPKIIGNIKKGINTIDSFTFSILTNNPGYNKIYPKKTRIEITNVLLNKDEFKGRVLLSNPKMDDKGLFSEEVTCESELGYLHDSKQRYVIYNNITPTDLLKRMLSKHNETVEDYKKFYLGIVEIEDNKPNEIPLDYNSTFDSIREHLIERLGGEIRVRYEGKKRYLDYLKSSGTKKDAEISLSKNLKTVELEKDPTNIITKLIPLGSKLEDSEERINISKVNNGLDYIIDEVAKEQFGINEDVITFDNITSEYELFKAGQSYLKENNRILKKYKVDALDLSLIGLDINSYEVGNSYKVINPIMNINEYIRVIEKSIDIREPQNSSLTIGDKFEDIKKYQSDMKKQNKQLKVELDNSKKEIKSTQKTLIKVDGKVNDNGNLIKGIQGDISNVNEEILGIKDKNNEIEGSLGGRINAIEYIQYISGFNLVPNSNWAKGCNHGWKITGSPTKHFLSSSLLVEDSNCIQLGDKESNNVSVIAIDSPKIFVVPGQELTLSAIGKLGDNAKLGLYLLFTDNSEDITINNSYMQGYKSVFFDEGAYNKKSITQVVPEGATYCFIRARVIRKNTSDKTNMIASISSINLVNGKVATRWTPNQLDGYLYTEYKLKNMLEGVVEDGKNT